MIQLAKKKIEDLTPDTQAVLIELQGLVDAKASFSDRKDEAKRQWSNKNGTKARKLAFNEIKEGLVGLCVSVEICNYCEQNEANDIEHIAPKSYFPNLAFDWYNYLLACKQCNTGYKLDKCHILDERNEVIELKRGEEPEFPTVAFINPRSENPNDFMILNMQTFKFDILDDLDKKSKNKAIKAREILRLNERATLVVARRNAAKYYYQRLKLLCDILQCESVQAIKKLLDPYDSGISDVLPLPTIKLALKNTFKKDIQGHQHPSVWYAIKTIERIVTPKWQKLFAQLPEAQDW